MGEFAASLAAARAKSGMTQSQLAHAAGLTPSYISFLESGKKPPPSDEVCLRIAEALSMPGRELLEIAHLERTPPTVRHRMDALGHRLRQERRLWQRLLDSLLSPFQDASLPVSAAWAMQSFDSSHAREERLRKTLRALGRRYADREKELRRLLDALPPAAGDRLLRALPQILRGDEAELAAEPESAEPVLLYAPPPASARGGSAYLLEARADAFDGGIRRGDRLLVDPRAEPRNHDILVLRGEAGALLRRLQTSGARCEWIDEGGRSEALDLAEAANRYARSGAGVVVEVRRRLRPPHAADAIAP